MQAQQLKKTAAGDQPVHSAVFILIFFGVIAVIMVTAHLLTGGRFMTGQNLGVIVSHTVYPTFIAWGICFLFACGYTDLSIGGVVVLGSFAAGIFGNYFGYIGVILGGLVVGTLLIFVNFNIFAFTKIPSWIAGISLAMIYEAVAVFLKVGKATKPLIDTELSRDTRLLGQLPLSIILLGVGLIVVYFIYNRTTIGLNIRAIGGNAHVSKALGINVLRTLLWVGLIAGLLIGVASFIQESYAGRTTVKTGLTSIFVIFQPLAIVLLAQILQKRINIIIAIPLCAFIIYAVFNLLTLLGVPSGTLQETFLGLFLIVFGILGQRDVKGVVK